MHLLCSAELRGERAETQRRLFFPPQSRSLKGVARCSARPAAAVAGGQGPRTRAVVCDILISFVAAL